MVWIKNILLEKTFFSVSNYQLMCSSYKGKHMIVCISCETSKLLIVVMYAITKVR